MGGGIGVRDCVGMRGGFTATVSFSRKYGRGKGMVTYG